MSPEVGVNWLGHKTTSKAATLDKMMLTGATVQEMEKIHGAVKNYLRHIEHEHGLSIKIDGETYKIDRAPLGLRE